MQLLIFPHGFFYKCKLKCDLVCGEQKCTYTHNYIHLHLPKRTNKRIHKTHRIGYFCGRRRYWEENTLFTSLGSLCLPYAGILSLKSSLKNKCLNCPPKMNNPNQRTLSNMPCLLFTMQFNTVIFECLLVLVRNGNPLNFGYQLHLGSWPPPPQPVTVPQAVVS